MAKTKKSRAQLEAELEYLKRGRIADAIILVVNNLIRWGCLALCAWFIQLAVISLSGKTTNSDTAIALVTDLKFNQWLAYVIGGSGFLYGAGQRKLRKASVERLSSRTQALELELDPGRSSSELTSKGDNRPEDIR